MSSYPEREPGERALRDRIERIVANATGIDANEIKDDVLIRDELGIDSLKAMEILAACEKELALELDEGDFACVDTVGSFFQLIIRAQRESGLG